MLHYHFETFDERPEHFYFDQVEINTNQEPAELRKLLPEKEFAQEASTLQMRRAFNEAKRVTQFIYSYKL